MPSKKYLITYNLKTPNRDYIGFYGAIQTLGEWWHYFDSVWVIKNSRFSPKEMYNILVPHITTQDSIFIVEIVPENKYGQLPPDAWLWISSQLPK